MGTPESPIRSSLGKFSGGQGLESKRPSVRRVLEFHGIQRLEQLRGLTQVEMKRFREDLDFFEQHPEITNEQAADYFRQAGEISYAIADRISEEGRTALQKLRDELAQSAAN